MTLMSVTGNPDGEPRKAGLPLVDVLTGKDAIIGILAALHRRAVTGAGEQVQVNLLSSLLCGLVNQAGGCLATGRSPRLMGNAHPSVAPYDTSRCVDGLLAVACGNDGQFGRLAAVLGVPELAADLRFVHNGYRVENRPAQVAALATDTTAAWEERLLTVDVPCGPVGDVACAVELVVSPGLAPVLDAGEVRAVRHPVRYGSASTAAATAPPTLGEHDALVCGWLASPAGAAIAPRVDGTER